MERTWVQKGLLHCYVNLMGCPSLDFLRCMTNGHLRSYLLCSSFFVSFSLSFCCPFPYFFLSFFSKTCIPNWYISFSLHSMIIDVEPGTLLCLFVRMREAAWELNQHPKEGTTDGISPGKPDPPTQQIPVVTWANKHLCCLRSFALDFLFPVGKTS